MLASTGQVVFVGGLDISWFHTEDRGECSGVHGSQANDTSGFNPAVGLQRQVCTHLLDYLLLRKPHTGAQYGHTLSSVVDESRRAGGQGLGQRAQPRGCGGRTTFSLIPRDHLAADLQLLGQVGP